MMMRWLKIAVMMMCLLMTAAFAEETAEKVVIYFQDGSRVLLPAEIANDAQKLDAYCAEYFPGRLYTKDAESAAYKYDASLSEKWAVETYGEGSRAMSVRLMKLGIHTSVVANTQGEELHVPTAELTIRGFEDKDHSVAVISAPRTGKASVRDKAASNGKVLTSAAAGSIVAVTEYTNASYTKIVYGDVEGYILTSCLIFQDTDKEPTGKGTVHIKGAVDGKSDVVIRNTASKSSAKVAEAATGTEVNIFAEQGDWYAVEGDGWFGYILKQYLKLNEE